MATAIATIKKWFAAGCYPTAAQFSAWIDSFRHKDEKVPMAEVEGLTDALNKKYDSVKGNKLEETVSEYNTTLNYYEGLSLSSVPGIGRYSLECTRIGSMSMKTATLVVSLNRIKNSASDVAVVSRGYLLIGYAEVEDGTIIENGAYNIIASSDGITWTHLI